MRTLDKKFMQEWQYDYPLGSQWISDHNQHSIVVGYDNGTIIVCFDASFLAHYSEWGAAKRLVKRIDEKELK